MHWDNCVRLCLLATPGSFTYIYPEYYGNSTCIINNVYNIYHTLNNRYNHAQQSINQIFLLLIAIDSSFCLYFNSTNQHISRNAWFWSKLITANKQHYWPRVPTKGHKNAKFKQEDLFSSNYVSFNYVSFNYASSHNGA